MIVPFRKISTKKRDKIGRAFGQSIVFFVIPTPNKFSKRLKFRLAKAVNIKFVPISL